MKKLGLAFGGGGGRGAYQIGVWRALIETGLDQHVKAISGTSVGAFNAALFLQGKYDTAINIWMNQLGEKILVPQRTARKALKTLSLPDLSQVAVSLGNQGFFSREGILQAIKEHINLEKLSQAPIPIIIAAVDSVKNNLRYFRLNGKTPEEIQKILSATSAIPFIFPPEIIEGHAFIDGGIPGVGDGCPISPLVENDCDTIIALPLDRVTGINHKDFPYTRIIEIIPSDSLWGFISAIDGLLDFSPEATQHRIKIGYADAMKILWEHNLTDIVAFNVVDHKKSKKYPKIQ